MNFLSLQKFSVEENVKYKTIKSLDITYHMSNPRTLDEVLEILDCSLKQKLKIQFALHAFGRNGFVVFISDKR